MTTQDPTGDEIVMYIVARTDAGMSAGKLAAQVGHGVQLAIRLAEKLAWATADLRLWEISSYPKIVLGGTRHDIAHLRLVVPTTMLAVVTDEGRTEIDAGTCTCVALVPMRKSDAKQYVGKLKLLKGTT